MFFFVCVWPVNVYVHHIFAAHSEGRRGRQIPLELELIDVVGPWNGSF